jgi:RNA polymerase sigma-B factor
VQTLAPRASNEQLFELWRHRNDRRARDELIRRFLPLARKLAGRYAGRREPVDDLVQIASLGLIKAVDRFDPGHGAPFMSFAVPTILGELRRYLRDLGWSLHVPRRKQQLALNVERAEQRLASASGRSPAVAEIAAFLEVSIDEALEALECVAAHHALSLEAPVGSEDDDPETLADLVGAEDVSFGRVEDRLTVTAVTAKLSPRERHVLELRFVHDLTQAQIGERIGLSQMQVSRILRGALARLDRLPW